MAEFTAPDPERELLPARRFEWERIVRRVHMPVTTLCVALLLASYGNQDGSRIRPGRDRLARVAGVSPKTISRSIVTLREMGLIELVSAGSGSAFHNAAAEYRLSFPPDVLGELEMLSPDESDGPEPALHKPVDDDRAGDAGVPGSESSMGHLTPEHGTSGTEHGTPVSGAGDIAMSTYQTRPTNRHQTMTTHVVETKVTSRAATDPVDEWDFPPADKCDCRDGFVGFDDDARPIPCTRCRPHLARVIPLRERNAG